ncbi:hypothetical protein ACN9MU_04665 [Pseudoduganella sp. R-32]|uniref:hypothetical protein n=1 Tax=Pseudoduganella sp. R-32 TaxID=3404061 RepID=UPI003CF3AD1D
MNKLVDKAARLAAMENLAKHFLSKAYSGENTASELRARHEIATAELVSGGDNFDAHDVMWLFSLLEYRAISEVNKFAALAQTTDPDAMLKYGLPKEVVNNVKVLKAHNGRQAKKVSANNARESKQAAKDKIEFQTWVKKTIKLEEHSGSIQIDDVRGMNGFKVTWRQTDVTLKLWLKEAIPGFSFKRGARKK